MARVKKGTNAIKHRRTILKMAKGYRHGRSTKEKLANEAIKHAGKHAFNDRRKKKGVFRRLWIVRLNAALRQEGETYANFLDKLTKKKIEVNRKVLSEIAAEDNASFKRIVEKVR